MVEALYVHIPFCSYKCFYCDFISFTNPEISHEEYIEFLLKEVSLYTDLSWDLKTIYLGGGTPSLMDPRLYEKLFKGLSELVNTDKVEEATVECNPETYREEEFRRIKDIGVNRVSIGVQSFRREGLEALGRRHKVEDALSCIFSAYKAGITNINVDLIYGYQGQGIRNLEEELSLLEDLPIKHVSLYLLTPYEDTMLGHLHAHGRISLPDEDTVADMYTFSTEKLRTMGFVHYEVSNFALDGYECKHNIAYWIGKEFIGVGVSAWSFSEGVRFGNTKSMRNYTESIKAGRKPIQYEDVLRDERSLEDFLFTRLRTKWGIPLSYSHLIPEDLWEFFERNEESIRIKEDKMVLINEILLRVYKNLYNVIRR
ncbi:MAG: radical SAM family heme chaperone HemW [Aquificaceae bacterium]